ncbi:MAG: threonine ammonia-lyase IlvA [Bacteroidota bacterium]|nr:threonine ammonia-lyase IlvA [Bacteroidota bacterium]
MSTKLINIENIRNASNKLADVVIKSPLEKNLKLNSNFSSNIYLKREDLQQVRSFKIRGALNKILSLSDSESSKGIVCASAGNHAQGFAFACKMLNIDGNVFMPIHTTKQKIQQVEKFGGDKIKIKLVGDNFGQAYAEALSFCKKNAKIFIHPFDDLKVIEGQATVFLEIIDQANFDIDYIFIPIGGGGLISGAINVFKQLSPKTKIIGIEPLGAPAMKTSINNNKNTTLKSIDGFVDGAAVKRVGEISFNFCKKYLDDLILIDEGEICQSILDLEKYHSIVAEPAGAMSNAALNIYSSKIINKNVVCIICGGNNDNSRMPEIQERASNWKNSKS